MDNLDDSENNAKVSDSAYSNSCSNSQSRRSHSSKSTHSGSNSSGSSGYGGKPSTSSSSNDLNDQKKEKELKKKKQVETLIIDSQIEECRPEENMTNILSEEGGATDDVTAPSPKQLQTERNDEIMDVTVPETNEDKEESIFYNTTLNNPATASPICRSALSNCDGFSCVISMHDGVVLYATASLTSTLGFPKDMWVGRSFIDFVHPRDRNTFASQITNGLAVPTVISHTEEIDQTIENQGSTMVCRIRRYRGLTCGFGVKDTTVAYLPFLLKFRFKNITDDKGTVIYLVIQAVPYFSAFKTPNEVLANTVSFVMRHNADGNLEYIDSVSVPYLGYLPQDITNRDALLLYHPGDLGFLQEVYQSLVKEGNVNRSKPYRLMTQNGHYLKVETEWSAFINPWSKKLEFVTGKHYIIEGPANPDVFQIPEITLNLTEEQKNKSKMYRDGIIRIMKEVLTKPAEIAKQQMSKRCQDLALFMEILMEEQPKAVDELRLEIQDADHSYYERDSVILGGISPHHEYDSKSSTETPLSYNQLNYNDNLQRYFNSHESNACVNNSIQQLSPRNPLQLPEPHISESNKDAPLITEHSENLVELNSSDQPGDVGNAGAALTGSLMEMKNYQHIRLTESLLTKHNAEMEKELMKVHREHRSFNKGDREKVSNEARQKKKEHLARCNATFQTIAIAKNTSSLYEKSHNLKRSAKQLESQPIGNKHHCPASRQPRRKQSATKGAVVQSLSTTTTVAYPQWTANPVNNVNSFILGVGMQPSMPIMNPLPVVPGMFPMYYTPAAASTVTTTEVSPSIPNVHQNNNNNNQYQQSLAPCMMYGQPIYGSPIMYSSISPQSPCFQQTFMTQSMHYNNALNPLCLANSNYEEACRASMPARSVLSAHRNKIRSERLDKRVNKSEQGNLDAESGTSLTPTSAPESIPSEDLKRPGRMRKSEETIDRTDGESSYSSFYSSFFKTESGSAEDSLDIKKADNIETKNKIANEVNTYNVPEQIKAPRRKMDPPWTEQVCVTSELIYKYQVVSKSMEEVLLADKQKMRSMEQPTLVNDQLGQLYLDLQLEGVASRLTLEEGMTSSSSSGEEASTSSKIVRKKREYSKLVMIYEENAPLPSPPENATIHTDSPVP